MALFRPYERTSPADREKARAQVTKRSGASAASVKKAPAASDEADKSSETPEARTSKAPVRKDAPTRTRKQAEAERMQRLHPNLSRKEQRKRNREARWKQREETWQRVEKSPERQLVRDYVDSRWSITEYTLPIMITLMLASMFTLRNPQISFYLALGLWLLMIVVVVSVYLQWRGVRRLLMERHPGSSRRGLFVYLLNRAVMVRRFRQPRPAVERGEEV